jgi:hypothetical protein
MKMLFTLSIAVLFQVSPDGWDLFSTVKFSPKLIKELNDYYLIPAFNSKIRFYEGKELTLEGYYMPLDLGDRNTIVISRNPYAQCFFCGGAGPESVAEITFASKPPKFKMDQIVRVSGILKLNDADIEHMNFMLTEAKLEAK